MTVREMRNILFKVEDQEAKMFLTDENGKRIPISPDCIFMECENVTIHAQLNEKLQKEQG